MTAQTSSLSEAANDSVALSTSRVAALGGELRYSFRLTSLYPRLVIGSGVMGELHFGIKPTYIPNSPGWFRGVMNRRGALVPIFDVTLWLGLGRDPSTDRRGILLFDGAPRTAGIWILGEPKLVTLVEDDHADKSAFPDPLRPFLTRGFDSDDGACFEFDHAGWFRLAGGRANA